MKNEPTVSSETLAIRTQTPGNYPKRKKITILILFVRYETRVSVHNGKFMTGILSEGVSVCAGLWFVLKSEEVTGYCILRGPDEEHILDVVPRRDGARNSG